MKKIKLKTIQYHIAYKTCGEKGYKVIPNNKKTWMADPFLFKFNGKLYIFAEMWMYKLGRGVIAYTEWDGRNFSEWKPVISEPYHLSYPNIFIKDGIIYLCPESHEANNIYLYKAISFPDKWQKEATLYEGGKFVDTTYFEFQNELFGFTYKHTSNNATGGELWIFKIENSKIIFLDNNPLSNDDAVARPAGNCIRRKNKQFRVSQDCHGMYGKGLVFSEMHFDGTNYSEQKIREMYPTDFDIDEKHHYLGVHTYNELDNFQVIDLRSYDFSFSLLFYRFFYKLGRYFGKNSNVQCKNGEI